MGGKYGGKGGGPGGNYGGGGGGAYGALAKERHDLPTYVHQQNSLPWQTITAIPLSCKVGVPADLHMFEWKYGGFFSTHSSTCGPCKCIKLTKKY